MCQLSLTLLDLKVFDFGGLQQLVTDNLKSGTKIYRSNMAYFISSEIYKVVSETTAESIR